MQPFSQDTNKNLSEKIEAESQGILLGIRTLYLPQISNEQEGLYAFGYFIDIENLLPYKVQLLFRKWKIKNDREEIKKVSGEGVIGKQPILKKTEIFSYNSWAQITTPSGTMSGEYTMKNLDTQEKFVVQIPQFYFFHPEIWQ